MKSLEGIYYALGFAGHGVALGTHLGMQMANTILDLTKQAFTFMSHQCNEIHTWKCVIIPF